MLLLLLLIKTSLQTITYDSSTFNQFSYTVSGFNCQNGYTKTSTVSFSGSFANVPQLFIFLTTLDFNYSTQQKILLEIVGVTLTGFTMKITCTNNKVNTYGFKWYAIDDARIQVITETNANPIASKQYPIQNPNTKKAIASIMSFGYNGQFNIDLSITELTSTHVTVSINSAFQNLIHLGYQIILGTEEALTFLDPRSCSNSYTSDLFTLQPNSYFVIGQTKLSTSLLSIRFQIALSQTSTQVSYTTSTWSSNTYPTNIMQPFFLDQILLKNYMLAICRKLFWFLSSKNKQSIKYFIIKDISNFQLLKKFFILLLPYIIILLFQLLHAYSVVQQQ